MQKIIVVDNPDQWKLDVNDVEVIAPGRYITDSSYQQSKGARIINLCKSYHYQSIGYYVSLLAEARKHKVLPGVSTIQDMRFPSILRSDLEDFDDLIQNSFKDLADDKAEFNIYFGQVSDDRYMKLGSQLFHYIQAPALNAVFFKKTKWALQTIKPLSLNEITEDQWPVLRTGMMKYLQRKHEIKPDKKKYELAILVNPSEKTPPSDEKAIQKFVRAADQAGFNVDIITKNDFGDLIQYDALFIRETTSVNHHTFRFAKKAQSLGLAVMDDPESILKCTNKVYLYELLTANNVPTPRSWIISRDNHKALPEALSFPFILKQPDGAFSKGVFKINNAEEYKDVCNTVFQKSELLIAQEFLPTEFDWRVGVVGGQAIFVCKYYMASRHWQIVKWNSNEPTQEGEVESLPVDNAPAGLIKTALKATSLIGKGLYGVDMKEVNGKFYVIEINDNPNIDAGMEDKVLKDKLYSIVIEEFLNKIKGEK
jgi:glutathione synthase/RimK-type ligase-like ATP-grasp enzyme